MIFSPLCYFNSQQIESEGTESNMWEEFMLFSEYYIQI